MFFNVVLKNVEAYPSSSKDYARIEGVQNFLGNDGQVHESKWFFKCFSLELAQNIVNVYDIDGEVYLSGMVVRSLNKETNLWNTEFVITKVTRSTAKVKEERKNQKVKGQSPKLTPNWRDRQ